MMKSYRSQIIFSVGWVMLTVLIGGFLLVRNVNNSQNVAPNLASMPVTEIPTTPETENIDMVTLFEAWQENYQDLPLRISLIENYPLFVPNEADVNIPEYYNGYDRQIVKIVISDNKAFIGINYQFNENVGGGTSAYAAHYGWDIDQQFGVLYATGNLSACVDRNFIARLNEFNLENGLFIITPDNAIIEANVTILDVCNQP